MPRASKVRECEYTTEEKPTKRHRLGRAIEAGGLARAWLVSEPAYTFQVSPIGEHPPYGQRSRRIMAVLQLKLTGPVYSYISDRFMDEDLLYYDSFECKITSFNVNLVSNILQVTLRFLYEEDSKPWLALLTVKNNSKRMH